MNKRELVETISEEVDASRQQVESVIDRFIQTVGSTLKKGEKLALTGFGTFEARSQSARTGQNPQTGEKIRIKAKTVPKFKPGQALKDEVAGGRGGGKKTSAKKASTKRSAPKKTAKKAAAKKSAKKAAGKKTAAKKSAKKAAPKKAAKKATAKKSVRKR